MRVEVYLGVRKGSRELLDTVRACAERQFMREVLRVVVSQLHRI